MKGKKEEGYLTLEEIIQLLQPKQQRVWAGVLQTRKAKAPTLNVNQCQRIIASLVQRQMTISEMARRHSQEQELSLYLKNIYHNKGLGIVQGKKCPQQYTAAFQYYQKYKQQIDLMYLQMGYQNNSGFWDKLSVVTNKFIGVNDQVQKLAQIKQRLEFFLLSKATYKKYRGLKVLTEDFQQVLENTKTMINRKAEELYRELGHQKSNDLTHLSTFLNVLKTYQSGFLKKKIKEQQLTVQKYSEREDPNKSEECSDDTNYKKRVKQGTKGRVKTNNKDDYEQIETKNKPEKPTDQMLKEKQHFIDTQAQIIRSINQFLMLKEDSELHDIIARIQLMRVQVEEVNAQLERQKKNGQFINQVTDNIREIKTALSQKDIFKNKFWMKDNYSEYHKITEKKRELLKKWIESKQYQIADHSLVLNNHEDLKFFYSTIEEQKKDKIKGFSKIYRFDSKQTSQEDFTLSLQQSVASRPNTLLLVRTGKNAAFGFFASSSYCGKYETNPTVSFVMNTKSRRVFFPGFHHLKLHKFQEGELVIGDNDIRIAEGGKLTSNFDNSNSFKKSKTQAVLDFLSIEQNEAFIEVIEVFQVHFEQEQITQKKYNTYPQQQEKKEEEKESLHEKEKQQIMNKIVNLHCHIFGEKVYKGEKGLISNVDELMERITRSFDLKKSKIENFKVKIKDFEAEVANLKVQLQKMKDEWEQKIKEIPKSIEETQKALSKLSDQNELQRKTISQLQTKNSDLERNSCKQTDFNLQIQVLNKEKSSLMIDRDRYRATIKTLKAKLNPDDAERFKNDLMIMPQEAKELKEKLSEADQKCLQLENQIKSLKVQIENTKPSKSHDEIQTMISKNEESIKALVEKEQKIELLNTQIDRLTEIIKENTEVKGQYEQKINELESKLQTKQTNLIESHANQIIEENANQKQTEVINQNQVEKPSNDQPSSDLEIKQAQGSKEVECNQQRAQSEKQQEKSEQKEVTNQEQFQDASNQKQENISRQEPAETERREEMQQEIAKLRKQRQILTLEVREKEGKLTSITASKNQLEKEIVDKRQVLKDIEKEIQLEKSKDQEQMKKVRELIVALQEEHSKLKENIKTGKQERQTIVQEVNRKKEELKATKVIIEELESKKAELQNQSKQIVLPIPGQSQAKAQITENRINSQNQEKEHDTSNFSMADNEGEKPEKNQGDVNLPPQNKPQNEEMCCLQKQQLSVEMQRKVQELEKTLNSLNKQIRQRELQASQLSEEMQTLESKKKQLLGDISAFESKKEQLSLDMQVLESKKEKLSRDLSALQSTKGELDQSRDAIEELDRQYDMKMDEITELEQKINTMKNKLAAPTKKSEKESQQVNMQIEKLQVIIQRKDQEIRKLKATAEQREKELRVMQMKNAELTEKTQSLQVNQVMINERRAIKSPIKHPYADAVNKAKLGREQQISKSKSNTSQPISELSKMELKNCELLQKINEMYETYGKQVQQTNELHQSIYQAKAELAQLQNKRINQQKDNQIRSLRQQLKSQIKGKTGDSLQK